MVDERAPPPTLTEGENETLDMPEGLGAFSKGQVLGERYQIIEMLGRGGMGEVWRAHDLKLRVDVALKALRPDFFKSERRLEMLRDEVRAAREVVSPNVCRIFDLIEIEGRELVSMEYVDGATLLGVLQDRGPLELKEAQDIASQFLAGLEAIHKAGLVHRDIKPENIMLTRAGRVVVMDFGLARQEEEGGGTVAGTPAYMAPEQAAGQQLDARADVYAAGVVLAEMVSPEGITSSESRQSLWQGVRSEPAQIPDSPWAPVITRAVARDRERRQNSAHTLIRELEDVTLRVEGAEDLHPYPGLASFTEEDAEYFFGREAEVEQMWRRLDRPHLLALVGPSGAGKTSFLRAGIAPGAGPGWKILRFTPGSTPFTSLGQALAREMAGDVEAMELLARGHDPEALTGVVSRWRQRHDAVLLIVDQFEELFTHCSSEEQHRFSELMGRLPIKADVFVLLSMRDDFLIRCREHESLSPVFTELTALLPPTGGALRRAVVQPATTCGYRFEDDDLVEEILAEVEGERGALPLLAFALARLWEQRDRETGFLTRQAYHDIGGVGGALAQHAESTIDRIGTERIPIVRELFRNLVTAEGTRAVREWHELPSVFDAQQRTAAEAVLGELVDSRLLTSYEIREDEHEPTRRVEIIHESLLANWPRLVRWQTQDQDGARLREELRTAARTWDDYGRPDDRLWTGTAYSEYQLWRDRYPGGLTEIEERFAAAMTALATRRRRRRRIAAIVGVSALIAVLAVVTGLWRRSVLHERRAEAQKLVALGQLQMEDHPTASLAFATASIALSDSEEARLLALEALWKGPTAFLANEDNANSLAFSPRGSWMAHVGRDEQNRMMVTSREGERRVVTLPEGAQNRDARVWFGAEEDYFVTEVGLFEKVSGTVALWSAPEARILASSEPADEHERLRAKAILTGPAGPSLRYLRRRGDLVHVEDLNADGRIDRLGSFRSTLRPFTVGGPCMPRLTGNWIGIVDGNEVSIVRVEADGLSEKRLLGRHEGEVFSFCDPDPHGRFLATLNEAGEIKLWDATGNRPPTTANDMRGAFFTNVSSDGAYFFAVDSYPRESKADMWIWSVVKGELHLRRRTQGIVQKRWPVFDPIGLRIAMDGPSPATRLWSLGKPAGSDPILLKRGPEGAGSPKFSPDGQWLTTYGDRGVAFWPLLRPFPAVIRLNLNRRIGGQAFDPQGRFLAIAADAQVSLLPLGETIPPAGHPVFMADGALLIWNLAISRDGTKFAVTGPGNNVWVGMDDGRGARRLEEIKGVFLNFSPDGRHICLINFGVSGSEAVIADAETDRQISAFRLPGVDFRTRPHFGSDGRLLISTSKGLLAWDFETGEHEILADLDVLGFVTDHDGRKLLLLEVGEQGVWDDPAGAPLFLDLDTGTTTRLETHGERVWTGDLSSDGTVAATADADGTIRVGPVTGEEPHLLLGHDGTVGHIAIDPLGRWIASSGPDRTGGSHSIRLWPMPDLSKPPIHTLPRNELIAKLRKLTNIRLERDPESSTGWKLSHEPFPGWETVPSW